MKVWVVAAIVVSSVAASAAPGSAAPCRAGVRQVNGVLSRVFCGPAKAAVKLGGKTLTYAGGACERTPAYFDVNIGIATLGQTTKPKPDYFGVLVGRAPGSSGPPAAKDGTYRRGVTVAAVSGGKGVAFVNAAVTLKGNRTRGTFTARTITGASVSGSFSC